jgi:hypothetical protein
MEKLLPYLILPAATIKYWLKIELQCRVSSLEAAQCLRMQSWPTAGDPLAGVRTNHPPITSSTDTSTPSLPHSAYSSDGIGSSPVTPCNSLLSTQTCFSGSPSSSASNIYLTRNSCTTARCASRSAFLSSAWCSLIRVRLGGGHGISGGSSSKRATVPQQKHVMKMPTLRSTVAARCHCRRRRAMSHGCSMASSRSRCRARVSSSREEYAAHAASSSPWKRPFSSCSFFTFHCC